ncbi:MAG TPA: lipopolysaccharide biosynthesis protein RfbH [Methanocella sp.]
MGTEELRQEILEKVRQFYHEQQKDRKFVPGKSQVSYAGRVYDEEEMIALADASLDFWLTAGRFARQFEEEFARFMGVRHCLLTNSGSSANLLAISALTSPKLGDRRLKPGDEVITTACGFPTTLNPILQNGLKPVFIDVEEGTYNIRADLIEEAITDRTKAIFVPHTLGNPADIGKIMKAVESHDLWFVEDNCDALGSEYGDRYTGTFGHIATFSFYPAHHMTMGEGGAVITDDFNLKRIIASFRDWGRDCWCDPGQDNSCGHRFDWKLGALPAGYDHKYTYSHIGYNLKVTDMQAAIGVAQLKKLPGFIEARRKNFATIAEGLRKYEKYLVLPRATEGSSPSWFGYPIIVRKVAPFRRDDIVRYLEDHKVATRMLFGGNLIKQPAYAGMEYRQHGSLEMTDRVMDDLFWIGVYPGLTAEMIDYVLAAFDRFMALKANR